MRCRTPFANCGAIDSARCTAAPLRRPGLPQFSRNFQHLTDQITGQDPNRRRRQPLHRSRRMLGAQSPSAARRSAAKRLCPGICRILKHSAAPGSLSSKWRPGPPREAQAPALFGISTRVQAERSLDLGERRRRDFEDFGCQRGHWASALIWRAFSLRLPARPIKPSNGDRQRLPARAGTRPRSRWGCPAPTSGAAQPSEQKRLAPSLPLPNLGFTQPDPALFHPHRVPAFQTHAHGNRAGDQGRWVTGSRK